MKSRFGFLLIEVLIAATILAVGILSCLRILSATIQLKDHLERTSTAIDMGEAFYLPLFLNPAAVSLDEGHWSDITARSMLGLTGQVDVREMIPESNDKENQDGSKLSAQAPKNQSRTVSSQKKIAFLTVKFSVPRNAKSTWLDLNLWVVRYGISRKA